MYHIFADLPVKPEMHETPYTNDLRPQAAFTPITITTIIIISQNY